MCAASRLVGDPLARSDAWRMKLQELVGVHSGVAVTCGVVGVEARRAGWGA